MTPKHLFVLLLAVIATSVAQNEDELHIPVENDNQFPPDNHPESDLIAEGSGAGVIDEPLETTTKVSDSPPPLIEDVQLSSTLITDPVTSATEHACPTSCVCNIEGDSNNFVVDCSGADLAELPKPLDPKTTELNLQNNKLTEIPKDISALKNLKILNVNNNEIMDIVAGSISELPELTSLKLGNNRLIEYPTDLKNSFGLTKLEELDLGGNDMRTALKTETFSNFKALRKLILPTAAGDLVEEVCAALKESLETVCTGSCTTKSFDCPDAPEDYDDDLLNVALPGLIALGNDDNGDPSVQSEPEIKSQNENKDNAQPPISSNVENTAAPNDTAISFRATVMQAPGEEVKPTDTESKPVETESTPAATEPKPAETETKPVEEAAPKATDNQESKPAEGRAAPTSQDQKDTAKPEGEVVGATTSDTKTGGVDKSVIGIIVAGMVVVVAGITIKKNWSSIKKRFSSTPRSANDRTGANSNGTAPEEVPLQEKSPV